MPELVRAESSPALVLFHMSDPLLNGFADDAEMLYCDFPSHAFRF